MLCEFCADGVPASGTVELKPMTVTFCLPLTQPTRYPVCASCIESFERREHSYRRGRYSGLLIPYADEFRDIRASYRVFERR